MLMVVWIVMVVWAEMAIAMLVAMVVVVEEVLVEILWAGIPVAVAILWLMKA